MKLHPLPRLTHRASLLVYLTVCLALIALGVVLP